MILNPEQIDEINRKYSSAHKLEFDHLQQSLSNRGLNAETLLRKLALLQVAIPSWALGAGGTRFGRFSMGGEPATLEEKLEDVAVLHTLTASAGAISLHLPWDTPTDVEAVRQKAAELHIEFDAVNSNTFQDQQNQEFSYKYGSLCHIDERVRNQAIEHNLEVVEIGEKIGSKSLTVWLADGSSFPGQHSFRKALDNTYKSLEKIYRGMPSDWELYVEYKPYEPNFYSTVISDWGTSHFLASQLGNRAFTLVDLGHHLPNTNIEQIVSTLLYLKKLGGFHFNDSKYGDDDLTVGSIKPYQLFLIFNELVSGTTDLKKDGRKLAWMIDASHNFKDPLEDLLQSIEAIMLAYAQALTLNKDKLKEARESSDPVHCQEVLMDAYRTDLRPLIREYRHRNGGALLPIEAYRALDIRRNLIAQRGVQTVATGL